MTSEFFKRPILNSPYARPGRHWELDRDGQPTQQIVEARREARYVTPIPKAKKQTAQAGLGFEPYEPIPIVNELRAAVDRWRAIPNPSDWHVSAETGLLLRHWRTHAFNHFRPFFCQLEAVETTIWLTEVAPKLGKSAQVFLTHIEDANAEASAEASRELARLALKLATGAGKTTVMAMLIAWQTLNAVRHPASRQFTRGFLIVTPGITIRDRLRVLQPNDPYSYYRERELVPAELLAEMGQARIVITNYHAFKRRELLELSKGGRALLQGHGAPVETLESEGQMMQRVMPELMGMKQILVINDEAHHCYREKPGGGEDDDDRGDADERKEAEKNREAARLWISGLEAVQRKMGVSRVIDLSATPFFLRGSGYREGTLFPWTMTDFSLMDAIECGIVKLPRVPVADNIPGAQVPVFRDLWENIRREMPRMGRAKAKAKAKGGAGGGGGGLDPLKIPTLLQTGLEALYGHYAKTFAAWQQAGVNVPPCFIVVCNNTSTSKLVYDYISGFVRTSDDGSEKPEPGRLPLFRNYDEHGNPLARPHTLLIDSEQLDSGEALDDKFRAAAAVEIERFRREKIERTGDRAAAEKETDEELLREVMNTVGKEGRLGEQVRCVVSVSMLTEGWDTNTVTHVLGVRAFGTQLLCEQVIGRALRRQSYDLNEEGLFNVEYADVLGIPFDFTATPVVGEVQPPRETIEVKAVRPDRDGLAIGFPRVLGYRVELPRDHIRAAFTEDSVLTLTPELVGPSITRNAGIAGEEVDLTLKHLSDTRQSEVLYALTKHLVLTKLRDADADPKFYLFYQLKRIARQWLETCLVCKGGTYPAQLMYAQLADLACERITAGIVMAEKGHAPIKAVLDPYTPEGSSSHVRFATSKTLRWKTDGRRCQVNWAILDSNWEGELCRVLEGHERVRAYVKNNGLGFEVPYRFGSVERKYLPDFIVRVEDGHGEEDLLNLVIEVKGYRREDAKEKKATMEAYWIPGVNHHGGFGRWAFAEFREVFDMEPELSAKIESEVSRIIQGQHGKKTDSAEA